MIVSSEFGVYDLQVIFSEIIIPLKRNLICLQSFWLEKTLLLNTLFWDFLYILNLILQHLNIIFLSYFTYIKYMSNEFFYMFLLNVDT